MVLRQRASQNIAGNDQLRRSWSRQPVLPADDEQGLTVDREQRRRQVPVASVERADVVMRGTDYKKQDNRAGGAFIRTNRLATTNCEHRPRRQYTNALTSRSLCASDWAKLLEFARRSMRTTRRDSTTSRSGAPERM